MTVADIIILVVVLAIVGLIVYFRFVKPKKENISPCCKCAYAKSCTKKDDKNHKC